jgi:Dolichyl-phosphate-mannose-protein mannosyltransferase
MHGILSRCRASRPAVWLRAHPLVLVTGVGLLVAGIAFACSRPVLLVNDGDTYMEMARSMRHGTLEVPNGLDIVGSPELRIIHTVQRGAHQYAKYPPLYAWLAVVPYALLGIRGMYLLNALSFALIVPAFYLLARRVLGPARARTSALILPFALPLVSYTLIELPHLVSLSLVTWAMVLWDRSRLHRDRAWAGSLGAGAGLLLGLAFGVRLQNVVFVPPLVAVAWFHARRRGWTVAGLVAGTGACLLAMAAINQDRFGTPNPFSYGPSPPEETAEYFLRPALVAVAATGVGALLVARRIRRAGWGVLAGGVGLAAIVSVAPLRTMAWRMAAATGSVLLNASIGGAGWSTPEYTHKWMDKALLVGAPFLILGLLGAVACCMRRAPPLPMAMSWMVVLMLIFLSARDPDVRSGRGTMGFMFLSPRYLVEIMVPLYVLGWRQLRGVRIPGAYALVGAALAVGLFTRMATDPDDFSRYRIVLLTDGSIFLAGLTLVSFLARRARVGAVVLACAAALTHGYAAACAFGEDGLAYTTLASVFQRWGDRILAVMPGRVALVGWGFTKDPVYWIRAERPVIIVDASADRAEGLADTLDALVARGWTPFYFGDDDALVRPRLQGRYRTVEVLEDPPLLRLERVTAP